MTALGKSVHLNRIFSHPSGRVLTVAVDHLITYPSGMPDGLRDLGGTIDEIAKGKPDAITMNKGAAMRFMPKHTGTVPFIVQQMAPRPDAPTFADHATVEEVAALGADAIAVAMFLKGDHEMSFIRHLSAVVREAERYGLPVIPHIYPLTSGDEKLAITHDPEDIFYCVRMGIEMGVDVIKVPFTGDVATFKDIVDICPVPIVAAGGPACDTLDDAVAMMRAVAQSGAQGATVGRNVWSFPDIPKAVETLKAAMYEG